VEVQVLSSAPTDLLGFSPPAFAPLVFFRYRKHDGGFALRLRVFRHIQSASPILLAAPALAALALHRISHEMGQERWLFRYACWLYL
jgi:hypothetical protein